ncbi:MAG: hypothetical protein HY399_08580 [Elusimicrobia bacterium]|nr:hypothetical protein [Elusimicrobiota bacterium]
MNQSRIKKLMGIGLVTLTFSAHNIDSETLTLTTYYPAPYGVYAQMRTTGDTFLAYDPAGTGKVGIGTTTPTNRLTVAGSADFSGALIAGGVVQVGRFSPPLPTTGVQEGSMAFDSTNYAFKGYANGVWTDLGGVGAITANGIFTGNVSNAGYTTLGTVTDGTRCFVALSRFVDYTRSATTAAECRIVGNSIMGKYIGDAGAGPDGYISCSYLCW